VTVDPAPPPDDVDAFINLAAAGMVHQSDVELPLALCALTRMMDRRGVMLRVDGDELEFVGPALPGWCEPIVRYWWDLLICAHAAVDTHQLRSCDKCHEIALLSPRRADRRCFTRPGCEGRMKNRLPIRFAGRPAHHPPSPHPRRTMRP
jgi:hypothetical protein